VRRNPPLDTMTEASAPPLTNKRPVERLDAVRRLRSTWLRTRGMAGMGSAQAVQVFLDNVHAGGGVIEIILVGVLGSVRVSFYRW
jgi:hypothetical protein